MKTACVYHSRDLDGWVSAAIVKLAHAIDIDFIPWDYGNDIPDLNGYEMVIMVDVSFPVEEMVRLLNTIDTKFVWIDHHVSAINSIPDSINGSRDVKFAACELTWMYFFPNDQMPEIVRLLGRYDCFGHKGTDEERKVLIFQYSARAKLTDMDTCYKALVDIKDVYIDGWLKVGEGIYSYLCTEAQQVYANRFNIVLDGYVFGCVNKERFNPVNFGINYHDYFYDGFACFWYKDGKFMYSLYNDNGLVNVSEIAKRRGGGGHAGASGFISDDIIK